MEVSSDDIRETNLLVSLAFEDIFRSTLGPTGLSKLIVKKEDFDLVSSNGLYIIKEMEDTHEYDHPTAQILMNAGKIQGDEVGDGVCTVMILIGALLKNGFDLNRMSVPFPVVIKSYSISSKKSIEIIESISKEEELSDELLLNIARSSLKQYAHLSDIVVNAVKRIGGEMPIDTDDVTIVAEKGEGVVETEFLDGVIIDKTELREDSPKKIENARIALINLSLEREKTRSDAKLMVSPSEFGVFKRKERDLLGEMIDLVIESKANIVCCQRGVEDWAADRLNREGILVLKRVKNTDMRRLERSTGGKTVDDLRELDSSKLGETEMVIERKIGRNEYIFFDGCPYQRSSAIIIRGGDMHVLEGVVSEVKNAMRCVAMVMEDCRILPGGGATEIEVARRLRRFASDVQGKEKLGVEAFARALETIPQILAQNAGMNRIDTMVTLKMEHERDQNAGISTSRKQIMDMMAEGIIEPIGVKSRAITSAVDASIGLLRIDDLVVAKQKEKKGLRMEYEAPEFKYRRGRIKY
jgi:chaperonin GroEL (HSP60 family)